MNRKGILFLLIITTVLMNVSEAKTLRGRGNPPSNSTICTECEAIVKVISNNIKIFNFTLVEIEKVVEGLCELIGGPIIYKECVVVIDAIQKIVDMIVDGYTPQQVCEELHLCSHNPIYEVEI